MTCCPKVAPTQRWPRASFTMVISRWATRNAISLNVAYRCAHEPRRPELRRQWTAGSGCTAPSLRSDLDARLCQPRGGAEDARNATCVVLEQKQRATVGKR